MSEMHLREEGDFYHWGQDELSCFVFSYSVFFFRLIYRSSRIWAYVKYIAFLTPKLLLLFFVFKYSPPHMDGCQISIAEKKTSLEFVNNEATHRMISESGQRYVWMSGVAFNCAWFAPIELELEEEINW